jgi:hypothetical protein
VPISNSSGAGSETTGNDVGSAAGAGAAVTPSGCPNSSRRDDHSADTSRASPRIRANAFARSVVDTAPRASSTLNVWEHLRTCTWAGTGSRASSRRRASAA